MLIILLHTIVVVYIWGSDARVATLLLYIANYRFARDVTYLVSVAILRRRLHRTRARRHGVHTRLADVTGVETQWAETTFRK